MSIEIVIVERPASDAVELLMGWRVQDGWIPASVNEEGHLVNLGDRIVGPHEDRPTTLSFQRSEWLALVEAIRREGPLGSVEAAALADTRATRDRLLTLVETVVNGEVRT